MTKPRLGGRTAQTRLVLAPGELPSPEVRRIIQRSEAQRAGIPPVCPYPSLKEIGVSTPPSPSPFLTPEEIPPAAPPRPSKARSCLRLIWEIVQTVLLTVLLYWGLNQLTARVEVHGQSMYPTFKGGEYVLVFRLAYRLGHPQRGDIVVFHPDTMSREDYIKRIIGLPGDTVRVRQGVVYVNGVPLDEPYIYEPPRYQGEWKVPPGYIFVLGDNRNNSRDSHTMGPVPLANVIGRAVFVYWPPESWGKIERPHFTNLPQNMGYRP